MKNQYFGDINDYRKYGLLRILCECSGLPLGVCWMLTQNDGGSDGKFLQYLDAPDTWQRFDSDLYERLLGLNTRKCLRSVSLADAWNVLPGAEYHSGFLTDSLADRESYFRTACTRLSSAPLFFFDPDNGLEVRSVRRGRKNSCKYLYWEEVRKAYARGHSVIIYQHFPRTERSGYIARRVKETVDHLGPPFVDTYSTGHVLFILAPRPEHVPGFERTQEVIAHRWQKQFLARRHVSETG